MQNSQEDVEYVQVDQKIKKAIQQAKKNFESEITGKNNSRIHNPLIQDDRQVIKPNYSEQARQAQKKQQDLANAKTIVDKRQFPKDKDPQNHDRRDKSPQNKNKKQKDSTQQKVGRNSQRADDQKSRKEVQQVDYSQNQKYKAKYFNDNFNQKKIFPEPRFRENQIFVDSEGHFNDFMAKVKKLIMKHDKIAVVANGINIVKAITIAQQANKVYQNKLRRINIPGTLQVQERYTPKNKNQQPFFKYKRISTITIELSLKYLDKRHMGYQDNIVQVNYDRKGRNRDRQRTQQQNDKTNYLQKPHAKQYVQKKKQNQRGHQGQYR